MLAGPDQRAFHQERRQHDAAGDAVGPRAGCSRGPRRSRDSRRARRSCRRRRRAGSGRSGARASRSGGSCSRATATGRPPACRPAPPGPAGARRTGSRARWWRSAGTRRGCPRGRRASCRSESRWLSPPVRKTRIIDFARGRRPGVGRPVLALAARSALARPSSSPASPSPRKPEKPTWSSSRRIIPGPCMWLGVMTSPPGVRPRYGPRIAQQALILSSTIGAWQVECRSCLDISAGLLPLVRPFRGVFR